MRCTALSLLPSRARTPSLRACRRPAPQQRRPHMAPRPRASAAAGSVAAGVTTAAAAWAAYYLLRCRLPPRIRAGPTPLNAALLARLPSLARPYTPPIWAVNAWVQLAVFMWRLSRLPRSTPFRRETLTAPDGGLIGFDWLDAPALPPTAPVLLILHTITGTARDFIELSKSAVARGFRPVVCLRRGHLGGALGAPRVNLLGCTADLRQQVAHVAALHPGAPLVAVGASAGTGLLVRYLGEEGSRAPLAAAVAICPGYDTGPGKAFSRFSAFTDAHILKAVKRFFLARPAHAAVLRAVPGYDAALSARTIAEYQRAVFALEGYTSEQELFEQTNPMGVAADIAVPICVINAVDDPVCSVQNVYDNAGLFDAPADRMLVLTERGSHCTYYEGLLWPRGSWCDRVALEYLAAVLALRAEEAATKGAPVVADDVGAAPAEAAAAVAAGSA